MNIDMHTAHRCAGVAFAIAALVAALAACDRREVEDDATATPAEPSLSREAGTPPANADRAIDVPIATNTPEPPGSEDAAGAGAVSQADALALLMTVDEHEIAVADQALGKSLDGAVKDYAQMMRADHSKNLTDTIRLGAAASTAPAVTALEEKGEGDLRTLDLQAGAAYEKAYIAAMVRGHTGTLALIDNTLLPATGDANIRQHFTTTRATVARHLERATEIQRTLK